MSVRCYTPPAAHILLLVTEKTSLSHTALHWHNDNITMSWCISTSNDVIACRRALLWSLTYHYQWLDSMFSSAVHVPVSWQASYPWYLPARFGDKCNDQIRRQEFWIRRFSCFVVKVLIVLALLISGSTEVKCCMYFGRGQKSRPRESLCTHNAKQLAG